MRLVALLQVSPREYRSKVPEFFHLIENLTDQDHRPVSGPLRSVLLLYEDGQELHVNSRLYHPRKIEMSVRGLLVERPPRLFERAIQASDLGTCMIHEVFQRER